jgi:hypothetical protein
MLLKGHDGGEDHSLMVRVRSMGPHTSLWLISTPTDDLISYQQAGMKTTYVKLEDGLPGNAHEMMLEKNGD